VASGWTLVGRREQLAVIDDARTTMATRGMLIHGPAGVGKSRLANEALETAEHDGWRTGRATASAAAAGIPLGALAHLLPSEVVDARVDPVTLYATVAEAFSAQAGRRPYVLVIDDVPRLDPASVTLVGQLLDTSAIFLIGTVRTGDASAAAVEDLSRREYLGRIDLHDLTETDVDTLLHLVLRGPVEPVTASAFWRSSRGNPLILRELVNGARITGRLVENHGVWGLLGPLPTTPKLVEVIESRLAAVNARARRALQILAVRAPIGLADLQGSVGDDVVDDIDRAGFVVARMDRRRIEIDLVHPIYGDVLREHMTPLARRQLLLDHSARVEARGARRRGDPLFVAAARLDAGVTADPDLLRAAMRLARYGHDHPQVIRLGRALMTDNPTSDAVLLLAEAHHELGNYDDAERVLAGHLADEKAGERLRIELVSMRVRNLVFGLRRPDDALAVLDETRARLTDPALLDELATDEAIVRMFSGRPVEALAVLDTITGTDVPRVSVLHDVVAALALNAVGRFETAAALARKGYEAHVALGDVTAIAHPGVHVIHRVHALAEGGHLEHAGRLSQRAYAVAVEQQPQSGAPIGHLWFAFWSGRVALIRGQPQTARRWLAEASAVARDAGYHGQRRIVLSFLVTACAWIGDTGAATAALADLEALEPWDYYRSDQEIGRAWAAVMVEGDVRRGREILLAAADWARGTGHQGSEARLLHDVARLGDPARARTRLDVLAETSEGLLAPVYAAHAGALADQSAVRIAEAADRFETIGAILLAAEATVAAAHAHQRDGHRREATSLLGHAEGLIQRCEGARTPGLVTSDSTVPLTAREREIATLAAERLTSREIAARLFLSARTVDNHLQRIYSKLGVSARAQIAEALRRVTAPSSDAPPHPPSSPRR
jgi:DNA-binding CsgD family transcriptional regulator